MRMIQRFWRCESAATSIEYGLIAAGIAVVLIAVLSNVGKNLTSTFKTVRKALK
jgi:pilus assembly protein Flp/PilA